MKALFLLASLFVAGLCSAASPRGGLLLMSRGDHFAVMQTNGSALREVFALGGPVVYGESADAFVFLTYRTQTGVFDAEILDKKTHAVMWSHPVSGRPMQMLDGPAESVVMTAKAIYFVSYPEGGGPEGVFHLNAVSRQDGVQEVIPIPSTIGWNLARDDAGAPVLRAREGDGLWRFNEATGASETTVGPSGLRGLQNGDGTAIKLFPAIYRGALAVGVVRLRAKKSASLAYVDPVKKIQLWEKPLLDGMTFGSAFAAPDGWNYFINPKTGAVTGLSDEAGSRELWKLPAEGNSLHEARILAIDE
jgi:hypothetical protein